MEFYTKINGKIKEDLKPNKEGCLDISHSFISGVLESNATEVYCYSNQLTELNLPNATEVYCYSNQLTELNLPNATKVYCDNNQLTELNLPNATEVDCYSNQLTELNLPNATKVYCYSNQLTELNLPNATEVYCYSNQLTELNLPNATKVYCDNNQLTELNLPNATEVDCYSNQLTELNLPNATEVYCYSNQLTELNLPNATKVYCYSNQLTELNLPNATEVYCYSNQLTEIKTNMLNYFNADIDTFFIHDNKKYQSIDTIPTHLKNTKTVGGFRVSIAYLKNNKTAFVAQKHKYYAHGETVKKAIEDCNFKFLNETVDKSYIVKEIKEKQSINTTQYRLLTGACSLGVERFLKEKNIKKTELPLEKALEITKNRYGYEALKTF